MDHAKTALITGASSGLGEAYARLHASLGGNLILVARREERLLALKTELEQAHHVTVHVLAKDLAEPDAPASLFAEVERLTRGSGRILNVSSIASLVPGPWQATYFAAKAYVTSLTLALSEELRGTGVTATVVLPGGMRTGFEAAAKLEGTGLAAQLTQSPDDVARRSYEAMLRGRRKLIAGTPLLQRLLLRLVPFAPTAFVLRVVARLHKR